MSPQGTNDNAPKFGPGMPGGRGPQGNGPQGQQPGPGPGPGATPPTGDRSWKFVLVAVIVLLIVFLSVPSLLSKSTSSTLSYSQFLQRVNAHQVSTAQVDNTTGVITGKLDDGGTYTTNGPVAASAAFSSGVNDMESKGVTVTFGNSSPSEWVNFLIYVLPIVLIIGFAWFFLRRTQAGMSGIMSIGRSRARLYSTERPRTTFADVAGYGGVKLEISEVVDFLKSPGRFKEMGARIPKGILLVGPPGTGKTLLARAVAGEAGVPFMSVSGSDFMEMFVGVGASRVRDLFQTARKQAPAIIFVDEIDSIGRKRGAGLGGGHDEREQTLNQMLSEMDGFDPAEGVVIIAATNRPDILDPALLRPGRFDRQIVVPLPDLEERLPILRVHCKDKRIGPDVDLGTVARGTPGMSGADLANLVNEAALYAVRRGAKQVEMRDFEESRDRVLMGQRRESLILSESEKERVAYHEGGHAVLAYVLPHADPVHKVTIFPTGMSLGATQQLPLEERHIYPRSVIEDSVCVRMGGRAAELIVYGDLSTGANNDLVGNTELARKMVREWGMSGELGPMAWGSQGMVFLGEDLMHTRDYSEDTSRVIDAEVAKILREQEERALDVLTRHRSGLEAVAEALLAQETIDGKSVGALVDQAFGRPVHPESNGHADPAKPSSDGQSSTPGQSSTAGQSPAPGQGPTSGQSPSPSDESVSGGVPPVATVPVVTGPVGTGSTQQVAGAAPLGGPVGSTQVGSTPLGSSGSQPAS
jgi:cell division protease FtsH